MTAVDPLIADATISQCEAGRYSPTARTLRLWAQALGMQPALVPIAYETAPAVPEIAAGNGATEGGHTFPPDAPASARSPVATAGPDVAPWDPCPCGHPWVQHDVAKYRGDGSETCCVEGCAQNGCPGKSVSLISTPGKPAVEGYSNLHDVPPTLNPNAVRDAYGLGPDPSVARTLDVAERTVGQAFAAGLSEMGTAMAAEVRRTHYYSALPLLPPVERGGQAPPA